MPLKNYKALKFASNCKELYSVKKCTCTWGGFLPTYPSLKSLGRDRGKHYCSGSFYLGTEVFFTKSWLLFHQESR